MLSHSKSRICIIRKEMILLRRLFLRVDISDQEIGSAGGDLFKAYCTCYRKENTFSVSEKTLTTEIFFEEEIHPSIVEAISKIPFNHIVELNFSDEENGIKERAEEKEDVKKKARRVPEIDEAGKKLMNEIIEPSTSFDDFVKRAQAFIGMGEYYTDFFSSVVEAASKTPAMAWELIKKTMEEDGKEYSMAKKIALSKFVKAKFTENGSKVTALVFLSEMIKYKDFIFEGKQDTISEAAEEDTHEETHEDIKEVTKEMPTCTILSNELVNRAMQESSYFDRVGVVFDEIRTSKFDSIGYDNYRGRIVDTLVSAAADHYEDASRNANDCVFIFIGKNFTSQQAHIIRAMVFQSIKDYSRSRGYERDDYTHHFLNDLRKLL